MKGIKFTTIILLLLMLYQGCLNLHSNTNFSKHFKNVKVGKTIPMNCFLNSQRTIVTETKVFLWLRSDFPSESELICFAICDRQLKVQMVMEKPIALIDSGRSDTLFGWTTKKWSDMPKNSASVKNHPYVTFNLSKLEEWNGYQSTSNAIVDSLVYQPQKNNIIAYLKMSKKLHLWPGRSKYYNNLDFYEQQFKKSVKIEIPLSKIIFGSKEDRYLELINNASNKATLDYLAVREGSVVSKLLTDIYIKLLSESEC